MNKLEYIILAINERRHLERGWLLSVFGILPKNTGDHIAVDAIDKLNKFHNDIGIKVTDGVMVVRINNKEETITDFELGKPLYDRDQKINLKAHDLKCIKQDILTTYGLLIINSLLIEYPYEGIIPYLNEEITPKKLNKIAAEALKSDKVTVPMHLKFENAIAAINVLAQTAVPTASEKSITPNKKAIELRNELVEKYKGQMNDPAIIAEIQKQLVALDKEYLKGDPSERFFITGKAVTSRLRTKGMYGAEQDFVDESKFEVMVQSLSEGWRIENLPMMANAIRGGSFNRGANTALGGNEVKIAARVFQNYTIKIEDCHTKLGLSLLVNEDNYKSYEGRYLVGNIKPLTDDIMKTHIGKYVILRAPNHCLGDGTNGVFCKKCMGDLISNSGIGITALMTTVLSSFLSLFLALMHGSTLSVKEYDYINRIT